MTTRFARTTATTTAPGSSPAKPDSSESPNARRTDCGASREEGGAGRSRESRPRPSASPAVQHRLLPGLGYLLVVLRVEVVGEILQALEVLVGVRVESLPQGVFPRRLHGDGGHGRRPAAPGEAQLHLA